MAESPCEQRRAILFDATLKHISRYLSMKHVVEDYLFYLRDYYKANVQWWNAICIGDFWSYGSTLEEIFEDIKKLKPPTTAPVSLAACTLHPNDWSTVFDEHATALQTFIEALDALEARVHAISKPSVHFANAICTQIKELKDIPIEIPYTWPRPAKPTPDTNVVR